MDAIEAIRTRRSIRAYTGDLIPRQDIEVIVDAGRLAASGSNLQPCDFVVVTKSEDIGRFSGGAEWVSDAAAIVAVVVNTQAHWWVEDGAAATQNMLVAATALGIGSCWLEGTLATRQQEFRNLLGVPDSHRIFTLVVLGMPAESPVKEKRSLDQVIHWERF